MTTSARGGDQPGLWPLSEHGNAAEAPNQRVSGAPATRRPDTPAPTGRRRPVRTELHSLWGIEDLEEYFGVSKQTVYAWRKKDYGPPAIKVGKHLRWRPAAVVEWAKQQERPTG